MPSLNQTIPPLTFNAAVGGAPTPGQFVPPGSNEPAIPCNYNTALARLGCPTISDTTLEWMLKPICSTPEALARAKAKYMEHANQLVPPSREFQMIGRKPEEGGEPALKLVPIPGDALSVRFFPGINGTVSFDFVKGDYDGEHSMGTGLRMPQGYVVHQAFFGHLIELKGIHEVFGWPLPPNGETFLVLDDATLILGRPGFADFLFSP